MNDFWTLTIVVMGILLLSLFSGMWISVALGLTGFLAIVIFGNREVAGSVAAMVLRNSLFSFTLTSLPLFILMGELVAYAGIGKLLFDGFAPITERFLRGGLIQATIIACSAFGAVCGSAIAGSVALGKVALPELKQRNYDIKLSTGALAAGGPLSMIVPPSLAFILFGTMVSVSISKLFIAGILPGLLITVLMMIATAITVWKWPYLVPAKSEDKRPLWQVLLALLKTIPVILLSFFVLYSIYGGIATPTEASAVGVLGVIVIGLIYRRGRGRFILDSLKSATRTSATLLFIVVGAMVFSTSINNIGFSNSVQQWLSALPVAHLVKFTIIVVFYIIAGMFIDGMSLLLITTPVLFPIMTAIGLDPLWIGVVVVILIGIGNLTPPVGLNLFALQAISGVHVFDIFRGALPHIIAYVLSIVILLYFPAIVTWLPGLMS